MGFFTARLYVIELILSRARLSSPVLHQPLTCQPDLSVFALVAGVPALVVAGQEKKHVIAVRVEEHAKEDLALIALEAIMCRLLPSLCYAMFVTTC